MNKRERLVPIAVLLGVLLVLILACSRFTTVPGAPSPTAPPRSIELDVDKWLKDHWDSWLARLTNVVTIGGVAFAIYALWVAQRNLKVAQEQLDAIRADQARIAKEGDRRPRIDFALKTHRLADWTIVLDETELDVTAVFGPNAAVSDIVAVQIEATNLGNIVATNVVWNYDFYNGAQVIQEQIYRRRYAIEHGYQRVMPLYPKINPQGIASTLIKFRVPRETPLIRVNASAYCAEVRGVRKSLYLHVNEQSRGELEDDLPEWP